MSEFEEVNESIEVPKNTGRAGFLRVIEDALKLPRVQDIHIDSRGRVKVRYFLREGETKKPIETDFSTLEPYAAIRNSVVQELVEPDDNAAVGVSQLFDGAAQDRLFPIAFVGSPTTRFWRWYESSTGIVLSSFDQLYGVPFLSEHALEDYVLVLCAGFTRSASLIDTQRSYKLVIPEVNS